MSEDKKEPKKPTSIQHLENGDVRLTFDDLQPGDAITIPDDATQIILDGGTP